MFQAPRFQLSLGAKTLCINYNKGRTCQNPGPKGAFCTKPNDNRKFFHLCGYDVGGRACGKNHKASEH